MLINILKETKGNVEDCEEVLIASKAYRENQDCLAKFVADKIRKFVYDPNVPERKSSKISITNAKNEFKAWWSREYDTKPPKEECINCDCRSNGLMIFNGRDHIHYREALEHDFYNILLLHYKGYND